MERAVPEAALSDGVYALVLALSPLWAEKPPKKVVDKPVGLSYP